MVDTESVLIAYCDAASYRDGLNVMAHLGVSNSLNNRFPRLRGVSVPEAIKQRVRELIVESQPGWLSKYPEFTVTVRDLSFRERGLYSYAVYSAPSEEATS